MLEMVVWDVDHGSAIYIKTPTGKHIAIDLGIGDMSSGQAFSPLKQLKWKYGVDKLDWLVITHPHRDHLDDIENVSLVSPLTITVNRGILAEHINKGNKPSDAEVIRQYNSLLQAYSFPPSPTVLTTNGGYWGCTIQQFFPVYDGSNLNNYSIVTVISHAGSKIVIPGDNEEASWKSLLNNPVFVEAIKGTHVFVSSHHGRASGFYGPLFDHFKPTLVLISDTNHGDTSVTSNYNYHATGWRVKSRKTGLMSPEPRYCLSTRKDGAILIKCYTWTDGKNYRDVSTEL